jgi:CheY-like chemotaxis protein/HPt (histidine-containing phosphotransfer) domain-containing protein
VRPPDLENVRVLIVDDNATNREILMTRLLAWGMRPSEARDGSAAYQYLTKAVEGDDPFRIAVIAMHMPDMNGEALGKKIQEEKRLSDTRMVLLTSLGDRGDARRFEEIGFAAYLTKPVRQHDLKNVFSIALAQKKAKPKLHSIVTRYTALDMLERFDDRDERILLAEDNKINRKVAMGILKKLGLKSDSVNNGEEVLKALETTSYDLILMDVQMPVMGGLETTRKIRSQETAVLNHKIPVIAMTANAIQGDREMCLAAGMNDYVSKPVTPQALAAVLAKWLPEAVRKKPTIRELKKPSDNDGDDIQSALIWNKTDMLDRLMGDMTLAKKIIEGFLDDIPVRIREMSILLRNDDAESVESHAHTIKGAAAYVGGEKMSHLAEKMEQWSNKGKLAMVDAHIEELKIYYEELKELVQKDDIIS